MESNVEVMWKYTVHKAIVRLSEVTCTQSTSSLDVEDWKRTFVTCFDKTAQP